MANLQYIGARYVPIVYSNPDDGTSDWKSGVAYENLVIVTYLDDSYTSRKPVPSHIGNPADNPTYWAKTGDFNAALTALQNQTNNIDNVEIPALDSRITNIENVKIPALDDKINKSYNSAYKHNRIICIGDSYQAQGDWAATLANCLGVSTDKLHVGAQGGIGFSCDVSPHTLTDNGFLREYNTVLAALNANQKSEVSDVVIMGGFNDQYTTDTAVENRILTGIRDIINSIKTNLPNARIYIGMIGAYLDGYYYSTYSTDALINAEFAYMSACEIYGATYLASPKYALLYPTASGVSAMFNTDGTHPTALGGAFIGRYAASDINNSSQCPTAICRTDNVTFNNADGTSTKVVPITIKAVGSRLELSLTPTSFAGMSLNITRKEDFIKFSEGTLPRNLWFNEHHYVAFPNVMIIGGVREHTNVMIELYHNTCTFYFTNNTQENVTLSQVNCVPIKFELELYNK